MLISFLCVAKSTSQPLPKKKKKDSTINDWKLLNILYVANHRDAML